MRAAARKRRAPATPKKISGENLSRLRENLGWSRSQFARVVKCSARSLANVEKGEAISAACASLIRELQAIHFELMQLMKPQEIGRWLIRRSEEFRGDAAADLIRRGQTEQLRRSLFYLRSGMPD